MATLESDELTANLFDVDDPVLNLIGDTSIIDYPGKEFNRIQCKLEFENPCGSMKDRIALGMILEMEKRGVISEGDLIVESSSGNTAAAVALVSNRLGYDCTITCPEGTSKIKTGFVKSLGADIVLCPDAESGSSAHYQTQAERIANEQGGVWLNQYKNQLNPLTHYSWTGPEIANQVGDDITHFVCAMGTGGTISGIGKYLKEQNEDIEIVGVDAEASNISNEFYGEERSEYNTEIEGLGKGEKLPTMWFDYIDDVRSVHDDIVKQRTLMEWKENGFLVGTSAASVLHIASNIVEEEENAEVLALICDGAEKYFDQLL